MTVHSKWRFNQKAQQLGLCVPQTRLITSREELLAIYSSESGKDLVFKPVYSRFAAFTVVRPQSEADLDKADPTEDKPWVAQEFLPGRPIATFSVAHQGRILAHTAYAQEFSIGNGPTVAYRPLEHPAAFEWAREFVERLDFTGQIGLDFMEDAHGDVSAIECNPRLTGGMFLLKDNPQLASAYVDPNFEQLISPSGRTYVFRLAAFFTILKHTDHFPGFWDWLRVMLFGRSTVGFQWNDPLPTLVEPWLNAEFIRRCIKEGKRGEELSTLDTEWSQEPDREGVPELEAKAL
jgi:predicted ATP-grasp superfamily ATP-dependent carboligase